MHQVIFYSPASNAAAESQDRANIEGALLEASKKRKATNPAALIVCHTDEEVYQRVEACGPQGTAAIIAKVGTDTDNPKTKARGYDILANVLKKQNPEVFTILFSHRYSVDPSARLSMVDSYGVQMVSHVMSDICRALDLVTRMPPIAVRSSAEYQRTANNSQQGLKTCNICGLKNLTQEELWTHFPLFHINRRDVSGKPCPVCGKTFDRCPTPVHLHYSHAPPGAIPPQHEKPKDVALCFVQRQSDGKILLCQEFMNKGFWLPAGKVDAGESSEVAAMREAYEEAGVLITIKGIMAAGNGGHHTTYYAVPRDEKHTTPKTLPDFDSAGACWVSMDEILSKKLRMRGSEPVYWANHLKSGGKITLSKPAPLWVPEAEDAPPARPPPPLPAAPPLAVAAKKPQQENRIPQQPSSGTTFCCFHLQGTCKFSDGACRNGSHDVHDGRSPCHFGSGCRIEKHQQWRL